MVSLRSIWTFVLGMLWGAWALVLGVGIWNHFNSTLFAILAPAGVGLFMISLFSTLEW